MTQDDNIYQQYIRSLFCLLLLLYLYIWLPRLLSYQAISLYLTCGLSLSLSLSRSCRLASSKSMNDYMK